MSAIDNASRRILACILPTRQRGRRCARAASLSFTGADLSLDLGLWGGGKEVDLALVIDRHAVRLQPLLGVHGRLAAVAGRGDRLAVAVVAHVAGHEDALD